MSQSRRYANLPKMYSVDDSLTCCSSLSAMSFLVVKETDDDNLSPDRSLRQLLSDRANLGLVAGRLLPLRMPMKD